jgi:hypothetical protein
MLDLDTSHPLYPMAHAVCFLFDTGARAEISFLIGDCESWKFLEPSSLRVLALFVSIEETLQ